MLHLLIISLSGIKGEIDLSSVFLQAQIFQGVRPHASFLCTVSNIHVISVALSDVSLLLKTLCLFFQHQRHSFHKEHKMGW